MKSYNLFNNNNYIETCKFIGNEYGDALIGGPVSHDEDYLLYDINDTAVYFQFDVVQKSIKIRMIWHENRIKETKSKLEEKLGNQLLEDSIKDSSERRSV